MPEQFPMTEDGYAKIQKEIAELETRRPQIKQAIAEAREKGDLKENADYHAAREELAMLEAKVGMLSAKLANSVIIDRSALPDDTVCLFRTVTFTRVKDGVEMKRTLVGEGEQDPAAGKILVNSPVGKALIGGKIGDVVVAQLPAGPTEFKIVGIE